MAPFPFFRLARELRDQVYKELGGERLCFNLMVPSSNPQHNPTHLSAMVSSAPTTDLLLVSCDFKHEYEMETWRRAVLWISTPIGTHHLPTRTLLMDNNMHRCFRRIPRLGLKIWRHRDYDSEKSCTTVRDMLLPYMDSLKQVRDILLYKFLADAFTQERELLLANSAFRIRSLTLPGRSHKIVILPEYQLECRQFSLAKSFQFRRREVAKWPVLLGSPGRKSYSKDMIQHHRQNTMIYRVVPVVEWSGRTTGVDYEILRNESFKLEEVMQRTEYVLRRNDPRWW